MELFANIIIANYLGLVLAPAIGAAGACYERSFGDIVLQDVNIASTEFL